MSGFVGSRAKRKQRNIFIFLCVIILIGIFYYIYPKIQTIDDNLIPNENIVPDPNKELTSLASNIEELELSVFQKDQQIKFRDGQIKKLAIELKETKSQYDSAIRALNQVNDDLNLLSSNNENLLATSDEFKSLQEEFNKLKGKNDNNLSKIKNLNKQIDKLNNNLQSTDNKTEDIINENQKLKIDNKSFFSQNIKLENSIAELKQKISEQQIEIDSYLEKIKKLKDTSHHGG
tara:strand:- start:224 stop:922 length:699 start_codon:yes stop_codon:yes gene_type:complete